MKSLPTMHDVVNPDHVQIDFDTTGRTMWVNIDGICYLRVTNAGAVDCQDLPLTRRADREEGAAK